MEKKPNKMPGDKSDLESVFRMNEGKERKPVYCAHPNKTSKEGNDAFIYECPLCGSHWISWDEEPKKEIGYVEAE